MPGVLTETALLSAAALRLERVHDTFGFATTVDDAATVDRPGPTGSTTHGGWTRLTDAITEPRTVQGWLGRIARATGGHRNVAASYLVLRLTGCVATPLIAAYLLEERGLPLDPPTTYVHAEHDQFDVLALTGGRIDDDVDAGAVALRLHRVLAPVIDTVAANAPYGVRTMWSSVADRLGGPTVLAASLGGLDPSTAWRRTQDVVDRLTDLGAPIRRRPRLVEVPWSGGLAVTSVKGTCCLKYVEHDLRPRDAAHSPAAFCGGCPYVDDGVRVAKRRAALERRPS
ncbi:ferric iron reductase [Jiangella asiatica]|uniref:Ferric iron reductase n=1 Tax=Jiangella asiatica TaxID=2530372 RepID=A0A4V2YZA9_9ACTN|nr:ferric iron reductase [Jiangella asiatica]TDD96397.1 ferric iron reductase [Jiangella asiatica]